MRVRHFCNDFNFEVSPCRALARAYRFGLFLSANFGTLKSEFSVWFFSPALCINRHFSVWGRVRHVSLILLKLLRLVLDGVDARHCLIVWNYRLQHVPPSPL